jgi:hypothetical protein
MDREPTAEISPTTTEPVHPAIVPAPTEIKNSITADILILKMKSVGKTSNHPFYMLNAGNGRFLQLFYLQYEESISFFYYYLSLLF